MQHRGLSIEASGVFRLLDSFNYRLLVTRMSFKTGTLHFIYNGFIEETNISAARRPRIYMESLHANNANMITILFTDENKTRDV